MGKVVFEISMSLDGFIAGPKDDSNPDRELGGLDILHDWRFGAKSPTEAEAYEVEKFKPMGAGIVGHRMLDLGIGPWGENPTFHMPIFVLSHETREPITKQGGTTYYFVTEGIESALKQAEEAARGKDIMVLGGAEVAQQYLKAELLDEIHIHLVPVLLGEGIRLFENIGTEQIRLEQMSVTEAPGVTHFRFCVVK
ncbi:MAG TPA: dihydrofolate reductase family protein [Anaerolineales bacterium]|nr:dihydrofolate reductase family protein [Anaerolineales bacterium]